MLKRQAVLLLFLASVASANIPPTPDNFLVYLIQDKMMLFLASLVCTLSIELAVAFVYISIRKLKTNALKQVAIANLASFPITWFFFQLNPASYRMAALIALVFAVFFEASLLYEQRKDLGKGNCIVASLLANGASFCLGNVVWLAPGLAFWAAGILGHSGSAGAVAS